MKIYKNKGYWIQYALKLAEQALKIGEVPVGAVITLNNKLIGEGKNCVISNNDPTAHAEIMAIRNAAKFKKNYRLTNSSIYVTLEPCLMCYEALIYSRIEKIIFGTYDNKSNITKILQRKSTNNIKKNKIKNKILTKKCSDILINFFKNKRKNNK
ncbi:tRNA adenosine(34) deaminase TadA [Candidatus Purcelliella pentastirinorum]|uniref:tRNA adenosine(34) deaminase TadA n=1 Tax=Candidatus Purcelliella pentastirinorum TaxID=472834 RepID=A0AAX3N9D5_9ENTR|nr:tRNA adenosine(34) deaminase TadA [Candidatus Purcelliella pentastirinorum]WDI78727.1 tRNA adenosine(34) deaminase TadA [Candidatus Purcelliella pentastirinorum]